MDNDQVDALRATGEWVDFVLTVLKNVGIACGVFGAFWMLVQVLPFIARFVTGAARRKRPSFEKAALLALASVMLPVLVAQAGLLLAGPVLAPALGWQIYVYGSLVAGTAAVVLGAQALTQLADPSLRTRATVATVAGAIVLVLLYASTRVAVGASTRRGLPNMHDFTTDVDDAPPFALLGDANATQCYPNRLVPLMREFYPDLLRPKTTTLPIGAAFIRALHIADSLGWVLATDIPYENGYVAPSVWMDKAEVGFEATSTTASPVFRIPDEVVVRVRGYTFDDGYTGAVVALRIRGLSASPTLMRKFLDDESW